jgi:abortive infection bacteriophage resistance protein
MTLKLATTHAQQLDILRKRGLLIEDYDSALHTLSNVSYYVLSGYLHGFKNADESFQEGLSFRRIYMIYKFDCRLKSVLLRAIESVEQMLKTKIAYTLAMYYPENPCMYENSALFKDKDEHERFIQSFRQNVKNNISLPFVSHHIRKYEGHFPVWVAVELFTLGNIKYLYKNLSNPVRRNISGEFDISPTILDSWIENLRRTRNSLAHDMRLYNMFFRFTPMLSEKRHKYRVITNQIFDQTYLLKILHYDFEEWKLIVADMKTLFSSFTEYVHPEAIGFPTEWESLLLDK